MIGRCEVAENRISMMMMMMMMSRPARLARWMSRHRILVFSVGSVLWCVSTITIIEVLLSMGYDPYRSGRSLLVSLICYLPAISIGIWERLYRRRWLRTVGPHRGAGGRCCIECGYAITDIPSGTCPECGRAFNAEESRRYFADWLGERVLEP